MSYKLVTLGVVAMAVFASAHPPCVCTRNLTPVCGSDGQTYGNPCLLDCQKSKSGADITVAKEGPCEGYTPTCFCTYEYKPVCGTDGVTYPNRCSLECEQRYKTINVASEGDCDAVKVAEPACVCPENIDEVCGTDGNTYDNACILNCQTAKNPSLGVQHKGRCIDKVKVVELPSLPQQPPCTCTDDLSEVCGSDGITYANPCLLNCATINNPSLSVKSHGKCQSPPQPPCICTEELNEVCGSDGNTYANPCLLNCATVNNPSLSVKSQGKCDKINVVAFPQGDQPACACPRNLKPVCGSDGHTYNNECLLRCQGGQVAMARFGPCDTFARDG